MPISRPSPVVPESLSETLERARIAVLVPCYNEEGTVRRVVEDFRRVLPSATVYVFDNASTDRTADEARDAGAVVVYEKRRGKGNVVAAMFAKVDADYYVMVDGDDTYPAEAAPSLLEPLVREQADMVVGQRLATYAEGSFRPLHVFGNRLVRWSINTIFSVKLTDIMSGYRAFTHEVAASVPVVASGFDVETEMTLQLLYRRFVLREVPVAYRARPEGSFSKLRTINDGALVLLKILGVFKAYKPLTFFGSLAIVTAVVGLIIGYFPVMEYVTERYVYSVPKAVLAASLMVLATLLAAMGVLLHTLNFRILEMTNILVRQAAAGSGRRRPDGSADGRINEESRLVEASRLSR
jgi:glycosyltransferase involved in cell wall biosynthesis